MVGRPANGGAALSAPGMGARLRAARELVAALDRRVPAAARALEVLDRDLLPRTAGGDAYLVCGIVGPNNAGKSALFNALVGRSVSPSLPAGGATRRLVGAAAPGLLERLRSEPTLARFCLCPASCGGCIEEALQPAGNPAELLVVTDPLLPDGLLLIDTPDFDSILEDNRLASESLLAVADLVVAVVTRHSYQNREVVRFLDHWLDHGRPWMLLYNEAINADVARAHAAKLIGQVGEPPLAVFWAPHSLAVQDGSAPLAALRLDAAAVTADRAGADLRSLLFDVGCIAEVKQRAFSAALERFGDELRALAASLALGAAQARELLEAAAARSRQVAREVALTAMPGGPFVEAFRAVLDRRTNVVSRGWRKILRAARLQLERLAAAVRGHSPPGANAPRRANVNEVEAVALRKAWPAFWEELVRDLGSEARHLARRDCRPEFAALLDRDLEERRRTAALERAAAMLADEGAELAAFRDVCEKLIEEAIEKRGFDVDIQALADVATLAPLAVAAGIVVKTGGLGVDLAVAGGGAVGSFLLEKYTHLLGTGILAAARRRWAELRGARLAEALAAAVFEHSGPVLRRAAEQDAKTAAELRALAQEIAGVAAGRVSAR